MRRHLHQLAGERLQLALRQLARVAADAALGTAKGDVHDGSLPRHQGGQAEGGVAVWAGASDSRNWEQGCPALPCAASVVVGREFVHCGSVLVAAMLSREGRSGLEERRAWRRCAATSPAHIVQVHLRTVPQTTLEGATGVVVLHAKGVEGGQLQGGQGMRAGEGCAYAKLGLACRWGQRKAFHCRERGTITPAAPLLRCIGRPLPTSSMGRGARRWQRCLVAPCPAHLAAVPPDGQLHCHLALGGLQQAPHGRREVQVLQRLCRPKLGVEARGIISRLLHGTAHVCTGHAASRGQLARRGQIQAPEMAVRASPAPML